MTTPPDPLGAIRAAMPADYTIDDHINSGGQGSVFRGSVNGTPAAIKVYSPTSDPRRIERELTALRAIDCPHLVKVLRTTPIDIGGTRHDVIAYELLEGHDLNEHLVAGRRLDAAALARLGLEVGTAIEHLWAKRIVHRDVKPANIMETATRNVLVDVGLARHLDRSALTMVGAVAGTPGYMSPEQAGGRRNLTNRSDVFSLGLTLYELATGVHPFGRDQRVVGHFPFASVGSLRKDLPTGLCALIDSMLHPVAHRRPDDLSLQFGQF
jgi:eukaryotic-like serine/threonine-protein kinase